MTGTRSPDAQGRKPYRAPEFKMIMHHSRTQADMVAAPDTGGNPGMNTS